MKTFAKSMIGLAVGLFLVSTSIPTGLSQTTPAAQTNAPAAAGAPPPSAPAKLSAAELEKLLMPIALYPDALLATLLPASVYPLEIVQAARFVTDTNNLAKLDEQPWDDSVKAIARIPAALEKMNKDLEWTIQVGEAFLNQDKDVMDTIQDLRNKAQKAGTLQTTEQQIVTVTNMVVEKTVEQQVVVVTNTIVQIQPSNPQTVYVPTYPPTVYYPPPSYVYNPYAPLVTFAAGVTMGAIIANNCDWHGGGCYWGGGDVDIDVDRNTTINRGDRTVNRGDRTTVNRGSGTGARAGTTGAGQKKWQPDQKRLQSSGAPGASARSQQARGWGGGSGTARASTQPAGGGRANASSIGARPSTGAGGNRPSSGSIGTRPATGAGGGAARPSASGSSINRPTQSRSSQGSAFGGVNSGRSTQSFSNRGSASRSGGFGGGGGGGRAGGGGRGGGGRR